MDRNFISFSFFRFLLSYERHVNGEEHKPLPISERRRLKSKRGSTSISETEANSCDTTQLPSTSKMPTNENVNENKVSWVQISSKHFFSSLNLDCFKNYLLINSTR